jgi:type VI secretion system ImpC/EvpB family protein
MDVPTASPPPAPSAGVPRAGEGMAPSLLDSVLTATHGAHAAELDSLDGFLHERWPWKALAWWLTRSGVRGARPSRQQVVRLLVRDIARLDDLLNRQVNAILHHPDFQQFEASWRGLRYLVDHAAEAENVKVRVLQLSWRELAKDMDKALEFDQSQLFRKVYSEEFGTPGGEPFGLLVGDYVVRPRPGPGHPTDDVLTLTGVASVAAASFAPFVTSAHPAFLDLEGFWELERPRNLEPTFAQPEYVKWRALRDAVDARFLGLTLPRVLMRLPYDGTGPARADGFPFREEVGAPDRAQYLWGNAAYAFGAVVIQAFGDCGWFADIRGVRPGQSGQGLAAGLPVQSFATDKAGVVPKCSTDVMLTEYQEKELADLGFMPLCHCPGTDLTAFFSNQSVQKPKVYDREAGTVNARLSAMLQYVLCVSRFAHYLKVMARDKVGEFSDPGGCETHLQRWLHNYTVANTEVDAETKARYPLRESRVEVKEVPGKPGSFQCLMHLQPHTQLDQVLASIRLVTQLSPGRRR